MPSHKPRDTCGRSSTLARYSPSTGLRYCRSRSHSPVNRICKFAARRFTALVVHNASSSGDCVILRPSRFRWRNWGGIKFLLRERSELERLAKRDGCGDWRFQATARLSLHGVLNRPNSPAPSASTPRPAHSIPIPLPWYRATATRRRSRHERGRLRSASAGKCATTRAVPVDPHDR